MSAEPIEIPAARLENDVLTALLEEYITREGTDYGLVELTLEEKLEQLRGLIDSGRAKILFDPVTSSCTLVPCQ